MPWMRDMTAMRVEVARMMPSKVRKLRNLFARSEPVAARAASKKDALECMSLDYQTMPAPELFPASHWQRISSTQKRRAPRARKPTCPP